MTIDLEYLKNRCDQEAAAGWQTCASIRIDTLLKLVAEVEHLRGERAAVVAWLRREIQKCGCDDDTAACIERGEHRREEEK